MGTGTCLHLAGENPELPLLPHLRKGNPKTPNSLFLRFGGYGTTVLGDLHGPPQSAEPRDLWVLPGEAVGGGGLEAITGAFGN